MNRGVRGHSSILTTVSLVLFLFSLIVINHAQEHKGNRFHKPRNQHGRAKDADHSSQRLSIGGDKHTHSANRKSTQVSSGNVTTLIPSHTDPILISRFATKKRTKPVNILMILADDLGYGDTSVAPFKGSSNILTPHLEQMAARGTILTNFHAAAPVCTPTRASLLTGMYPWRLGIKAVFEYGERDGKSNRDDWLLQVPTAAMLFAERGYNTYHSGKWHVGGMRNDDLNMRRLPEKEPGSKGGRRCPHPGPNQQGFMHYVSVLDGPGAPRQNELQIEEKLYREGCQFLLENDERLSHPAYNISGYLSYCEARHAMRFMDQSVKEGKPFYLQLWFHAPHGPWETIPGYNEWYPQHRRPKSASEPGVPQCGSQQVKGYRFCYNNVGGARNLIDRGMNRLMKYRTMVSDMDKQIGMVLQHLETLQIARDTLVLFTSDNGPEDDAGSPGVFRGRKRFLYEGGIRVPAIVQWPGTVPAGAVVNTMGVSTDVFPTFLDAAGLLSDLPPQYKIDGTSLLPDLLAATHNPFPSSSGLAHEPGLLARLPNLVRRSPPKHNSNPDPDDRTTTNSTSTGTSGEDNLFLALNLPPQTVANAKSFSPLVLSPIESKDKSSARRRSLRRHAMQERLILWHSDFEGPRRTAGVLYGFKLVLNQEDVPMELFDLSVDPQEERNLLPLPEGETHPSGDGNVHPYWRKFAQQWPKVTLPKGFSLTDATTPVSTKQLMEQRDNTDVLFLFVLRIYHAVQSFAEHGADGYKTYLKQYPALRYKPTPPSEHRPMITNIYKKIPRERMGAVVHQFLHEGFCEVGLPCNCSRPLAHQVPALPFPTSLLMDSGKVDVLATTIATPHGFVNGSLLLTMNWKK